MIVAAAVVVLALVLVGVVALRPKPPSGVVDAAAQRAAGERTPGPESTPVPPRAGGDTGSAPSPHQADPIEVLWFSPSATCEAPGNVDVAGNPTNYRPANVVDGDRTTAWRCPGDASGQSIAVHSTGWSSVVSVGLVPGYAKVDSKSGENRFLQERRIRSATWECRSANGTLVGSAVQSFADSPAMQTMPVAFAACDSLKLVIGQTTLPGDGRFDYTAISDIEVRGCCNADLG